MPRNPRRSQKLTDKEREQWFVSLFIYTYGANPAEVSACEKRAGLPAGSGEKILKRKSVKAEIEKISAPVVKEQVRQEVLSDSIQKAKAVYQEELASQVEIIHMHNLELPTIRARLAQGIICLDLKTHPRELLDFIKTGLVIERVMEGTGIGRGVIPADEVPEGRSSVYESIFDRPRLSPPPDAPLSKTAPNAQEEQVYDLYPVDPSAKPEVIPDGPMPAPGQSLEEPEPEKGDPDVITVTVE